MRRDYVRMHKKFENRVKSGGIVKNEEEEELR